MKIRYPIPLLIIAFITAFLLGRFGILSQADAKDKISLTYAFFAPAGTFPGKQMAHWAEEIEKRTGGLV